jgi:hypothetical protein
MLRGCQMKIVRMSAVLLLLVCANACADMGRRFVAD